MIGLNHLHNQPQFVSKDYLGSAYFVETDFFFAKSTIDKCKS